MSARHAAVELAAEPEATDPDRVAHARDRLPSADDAIRLTGLLSLMADPVRLRILMLIRFGPLPPSASGD